MSKEAEEYYREWGKDKHYMGDEEDWAITFATDFASEQVAKALEDVEKALMSDNEIEEHNWLVKEHLKEQRNKVQEVINKLRP